MSLSMYLESAWLFWLLVGSPGIAVSSGWQSPPMIIGSRIQPVPIQAPRLRGHVFPTIGGATDFSARIDLLLTRSGHADSILTHVFTGPAGIFEFRNLPRGQFILRVRSIGHERVRIPIEVGAAGAAAITIGLRPDVVRVEGVCAGIGGCMAEPRREILGFVRCVGNGRVLPADLVVEARVDSSSAPQEIALPDSHGAFRFTTLLFYPWVVAVRQGNRDLSITTISPKDSLPRLIFALACQG